MKIRTIVGVLLVLALVLGSTGVASAGDGNGPYVDPRDDDRDEIPNGQDPDYFPPQDGTGYEDPQW